MPRIRQLADQYAEADRIAAKNAFRDDIAQKQFENRLLSDRKLAGAIGVSAACAGNYRREPEMMQIKTVQKLVEILKPDIATLLRFIGYSEKEIRRFALESVERNTTGRGVN